MGVTNRLAALVMQTGRPEACRAHAERFEHMLTHQLFPRRAEPRFEHGGGDDIAAVRIDERGFLLASGILAQRMARDHLPTLARIVFAQWQPDHTEFDNVSLQAGAMRQQMQEIRVAIFLADLGQHFAERGFHRVAPIDPAGVDASRHQSRRHGFCDRAQMPAIVERDLVRPATPAHTRNPRHNRARFRLRRGRERRRADAFAQSVEFCLCEAVRRNQRRYGHDRATRRLHRALLAHSRRTAGGNRPYGKTSAEAPACNPPSAADQVIPQRRHSTPNTAKPLFPDRPQVKAMRGVTVVTSPRPGSR